MSSYIDNRDWSINTYNFTEGRFRQFSTAAKSGNSSAGRYGSFSRGDCRSRRDGAKSNRATIAIANEPPYIQINPDGTPGGWGTEMDAAILGAVGAANFSG
ncbi:hypothetical protein NKJ06_28960 [Mesorhizobium sp. M0293]|uniref:hypothetical protein n=1 Tax=Mesorhizobium sp. M0293 TaxID=2956930 RepID=UPI003337AC4A